MRFVCQHMLTGHWHPTMFCLPSWWLTYVHHPAAARPNCMGSAAGRLSFVAAQPGPQSHRRRGAKRCSPSAAPARELQAAPGRERHSGGVIPSAVCPHKPLPYRRLGWGGLLVLGHFRLKPDRDPLWCKRYKDLMRCPVEATSGFAGRAQRHRGLRHLLPLLPS